jgi:hypothetical protein
LIIGYRLSAIEYQLKAWGAEMSAAAVRYPLFAVRYTTALAILPAVWKKESTTEAQSHRDDSEKTRCHQPAVSSPLSAIRFRCQQYNSFGNPASGVGNRIHHRGTESQRRFRKHPLSSSGCSLSAIRYPLFAVQRLWHRASGVEKESTTEAQSHRDTYQARVKA